MLYLARSGGGKSQAVKQSRAIPTPNTGARVILWDPARDQWRGTTYRAEPGEFARVLAAAERSGRGYRLGYDGPRSVDVFEWFCRCVWTVLDGRRPLTLIVEELGAVCAHAGEAPPAHRLLWSEGRKYALAIHATSQRPQEISKTAFENAGTWWVGPQKGENVRRFARRLDVPEDQVRNLADLEFLVLDESTAGPAVKRSLRYVR